jgi:Na+/melibiose symporter-like transporter
MFLVGLYLIRTSHQLVTYHNLRAFYKPDQYAHIPKKNRDHYAEGIGKALGFLGGIFVASAILYFVEATMLTNKIFFWGVQVIFLGGFVIGIIMIYKTNKTYANEDFNRVKKRKS